MIALRFALTAGDDAAGALLALMLAVILLIMMLEGLIMGDCRAEALWLLAVAT